MLSDKLIDRLLARKEIVDYFEAVMRSDPGLNPRTVAVVVLEWVAPLMGRTWH